MSLLEEARRDGGAQMRIKRRYRCRADSVRAARAMVHELSLDGELEDRAALVVSEMATNAVEHGGGDFEVRLDTGPPLRIEVADHSNNLPRRRPLNLWSEGGRGLHVIDQLTSSWGTTQSLDGKVVWAELAG